MPCSRLIGDLHRKLDHISLAQEARGIGLDHEVLGSHHGACQESASQRLVMRESHETPLGEVLGQGKLNTDFAVSAGLEMRVEKGRFIKYCPGNHLIQIHGRWQRILRVEPAL